MPAEPEKKRTIAFVDGQNLYHAAKAAFGYTFPNYDIRALCESVCADKGWEFTQCRFYTGVPNPADEAFWHHFWTAKTAQMGRQNIYVYTRSLRYRNKQVTLPNGVKHSFLVAEEKGIDVRIALDIIRLAHARDYDIALVQPRSGPFRVCRRNQGYIDRAKPLDKNGQRFSRQPDLR